MYRPVVIGHAEEDFFYDTQPDLVSSSSINSRYDEVGNSGVMFEVNKGCHNQGQYINESISEDGDVGT